MYWGTWVYNSELVFCENRWFAGGNRTIAQKYNMNLNTHQSKFLEVAIAKTSLQWYPHRNCALPARDIRDQSALKPMYCSSTGLLIFPQGSQFMNVTHQFSENTNRSWFAYFATTAHQTIICWENRYCGTEFNPLCSSHCWWYIL